MKINKFGQNITQAKESLVGKLRLIQKISFVFQVLSTLLYLGIVSYTFIDKWQTDKTLIWIISAVTAVYLALMIAILFFNKQDKKLASIQLKSYKQTITIIKLLISVVNVVMSLIILGENAGSSLISTLFTYAFTFVSILNLTIRIVLSIFSIRSNIKKYAKIKTKRQLIEEQRIQKEKEQQELLISIEKEKQAKQIKQEQSNQKRKALLTAATDTVKKPINKIKELINKNNKD